MIDISDREDHTHTGPTLSDASGNTATPVELGVSRKFTTDFQDPNHTSCTSEDIQRDVLPCQNSISSGILCESLRNSIIGQNESFEGAFGRRRITYCDHTASSRAVSFIEDYIRSEVLPVYANTHTSTSHAGVQTTLFRKEARDIVLRSVHASKDDVCLFAGTGSTGAISRLVSLLCVSARVRAGIKCVVFSGAYEHHSNTLLWIEAGAELIYVEESARGGVDLDDLKSKLEHFKDYDLKIGSFSAASNITGMLEDTESVTAMLHRHGALSFWDYASAAPYVKIDMNPRSDDPDSKLYEKDAIFMSPHKFIGGVATPGVLIVKKALVCNEIPSVPGGGTVFFVSRDGHRYLGNFEEREEGGTQDIVG
eukprot:248651_1